MSARKIPFWATLFTLLGLAVLLGLGVWQLERLRWKEALIAARAAEEAKDPLDNLLTFETLAAQGAALDWRRGAVRGRFLHTREIPLGPRTHEGRSGYHIFTPLEMAGGGTILVNRGWVPAELRDPFSRPESLIGGEILLAGTFRLPETPNAFVGENIPERGQWYRLDLAQVAQARQIGNLAPVTLYAEIGPAPGPYPLMEALRRDFSNNHLGYALFWFSMAAVLLVVYVLRFLRKES